MGTQNFSLSHARDKTKKHPSVSMTFVTLKPYTAVSLIALHWIDFS